MLFDWHDSVKAVNPQTGHIRASVRDLMGMLKDPEFASSVYCCDENMHIEREEFFAKFVRVIQTPNELILQRMFVSHNNGPFSTLSVVMPCRQRTYGVVAVSRRGLLQRLGKCAPDDIIELTQETDQVVINNLTDGTSSTSRGIDNKHLPNMPTGIEPCVSSFKVHSDALLQCFDYCKPSLSFSLLAPDGNAYLHLKVLGRKRAGSLAAVAVNGYVVMHFESSVRGHFPDESVLLTAIPKFCVERLCWMLRGQEETVELSITPSGGFVSWKHYRVNFLRPETPLSDLTELAKASEKTLRSTVVDVADLKRALWQNESIWQKDNGSIMCLKQEGVGLSVSFVVNGKVQGEKSLIPAENLSGKSDDFYINAWAIHRALENVKPDLVEIRGYPNAEKPIYFKGLGDPYWVLIVQGSKMRLD